MTVSQNYTVENIEITKSKMIFLTQLKREKGESFEARRLTSSQNKVIGKEQDLHDIDDPYHSSGSLKYSGPSKSKRR